VLDLFCKVVGVVNERLGSKGLDDLMLELEGVKGLLLISSIFHGSA